MGAMGMRRSLATSSSCEQHYLQAAYAEASRGASILHRHFGPAPAAEALQALAAKTGRANPKTRSHRQLHDTAAARLCEAPRGDAHPSDKQHD